MVLAAGEGSRLRPLTDDRPKPMIEIAGAPILEHNVRRLVQHGFREIFINLHYLPNVITSHFGDGARFGAHITYSLEEELLGTAGGTKRVEHLLGDTFLLVYGDNLSLCDFSDLAEQHRRSGAALTMALFEREDPASSGIVELAGDDRILRFVEKPRPDEIFSKWVNAGVLAVNARVLELIPKGQIFDFGRNVFPLLMARGEDVRGYRMGPNTLWWIDSLADYEYTRAVFETSQARAQLYDNSI